MPKTSVICERGKGARASLLAQPSPGNIDCLDNVEILLRQTQSHGLLITIYLQYYEQQCGYPHQIEYIIIYLNNVL